MSSIAVRILSALGLLAALAVGAVALWAAAPGELTGKRAHAADRSASDPTPARARGARWTDGPPARQVFEPTTGRHPRGAILLIHGGGWQGGEPRHMKSISYDGRRLAEWGYLVWSVDYASGRGSLPDLIQWRRLLRQRRPKLPICAVGTSAGGNLALLLAARTPLRCTVSESGPTDLFRLRFRTVEEYFPKPRHKRAYSPMSYIDRGAYANDRLLIAHLREDSIVPFNQSRRFARRTGTRLVGLPPGETPFVHGRADTKALERYRRTQRSFLARAMRAMQRPARPPRG